MDSEGTPTGASGRTDRPGPSNGRGRTVPYGPTQGTPCALCASPLGGGDDLVIHYHRGGDAVDGPVPAPETDCRGVCPECAGAVTELLAAWTATARPSVRAERSIRAGYVAIAEECSFCDRAVGGQPVVGVESYRAGTNHEDGFGRHRHYVLCPNCVGVFERFLEDVAGDAGDRPPDSGA